MKFYCETFHEERDTGNCCYCSAACSQRPSQETYSDTGVKAIEQRSEKITIVFTYDEMPFLRRENTHYLILRQISPGSPSFFGVSCRPSFHAFVPRDVSFLKLSVLLCPNRFNI